MKRWIVARYWAVEAESVDQAIAAAAPGGHRWVRAAEAGLCPHPQLDTFGETNVCILCEERID